jgi:hypothetical protein
MYGPRYLAPRSPPASNGQDALKNGIEGELSKLLDTLQQLAQAAAKAVIALI